MLKSLLQLQVRYLNMPFLCQNQPYLTSTTAKILQIKPSESKKFKPHLEVEFDSALIFPEGGGQPSDVGEILSSEGLKIADIINSYRAGEKAISIVKPIDNQQDKLNLNDDYTIKLDFERRFDHMQQHTGQHLISAIAEKEPFNMNTTSWWLGTDMCNVEFDKKQVSDDELRLLENKCNQVIRNATQDVIIHQTDKAGADKLGASTRGLPDDHVGVLRVVELPNGVDMNLCCGTHLKNLRELQMIKIISAEKGKKNKTLVNFACGNRVLKFLEFSTQHQAGLTKVLKGGPKDHVDKAALLLSRMTTVEKGLKNNLMDLAKLEAATYNSQVELFLKDSQTADAESGPKMPILDRHNKDGTNDFLIVLSNAVNKQGKAFLTIGDAKIKNNTHMFIVLAENLENISDQILKLIEGKGVCKNGKMQGKCSNLKNRNQVIALLESL